MLIRYLQLLLQVLKWIPHRRVLLHWHRRVHHLHLLLFRCVVFYRVHYRVHNRVFYLLSSAVIDQRGTHHEAVPHQLLSEAHPDSLAQPDSLLGKHPLLAPGHYL